MITRHRVLLSIDYAMPNETSAQIFCLLTSMLNNGGTSVVLSANHHCCAAFFALSPGWLHFYLTYILNSHFSVRTRVTTVTIEFVAN